MKHTIIAVTGASLICQTVPRQAFTLAATDKSVKQTKVKQLDGFDSPNAPILDTDKKNLLWLKTRQTVSLLYVAAQLGIPADDMAALNGVDIEHRFSKGEWLVAPSRLRLVADQVAVLDTKNTHDTPQISDDMQVVLPEANSGDGHNSLSPIAAAKGTARPPTDESEVSKNNYLLSVRSPQPLSLCDLARLIEEPLSQVGTLNGVRNDHIFVAGAWIRIPAARISLAQKAGLGSFKDDQHLPASLPITQVAPTIPTKGAVRTTMDEILRLNPGLDLSHAAAGTEIRLPNAEPSPNADSGIQRLETLKGLQSVLVRAPLSPALAANNSQPQPQLARQDQPNMPSYSHFDQRMDELERERLVRQGVLSPSERQSIRRFATADPHLSENYKRACREGVLSRSECTRDVLVRWRSADAQSRAGMSLLQAPRAVPQNTQKQAIPEIQLRTPTISPIVKPLSDREAALLQRIRSNSRPVWRLYGKCKYNWSNWHKLHEDIIVTEADCGPSLAWSIGVSCKRLMTNIYTDQFGWQGWTKPAGPDQETRAGEDEMVAALCANLTDKR
jgi:hypothetical protein